MNDTRAWLARRGAPDEDRTRTNGSTIRCADHYTTRAHLAEGQRIELWSRSSRPGVFKTLSSSMPGAFHNVWGSETGDNGRCRAGSIAVLQTAAFPFRHVVIGAPGRTQTAISLRSKRSAMFFRRRAHLFARPSSCIGAWMAPGDGIKPPFEDSKSSVLSARRSGNRPRGGTRTLTDSLRRRACLRWHRARIDWCTPRGSNPDFTD